MTDGERGRKVYWWNLNIDPNEELSAGQQMMRTIAIWFAVVLVLALVIGLIVALS